MQPQPSAEAAARGDFGRGGPAGDGGSADGVSPGAVGLRESFLAAATPDAKSPAPLLPALAARRVAALVNLLESLHELRDPVRAGGGDTYRAGGLLLGPHEGDCKLFGREAVCTCVLSAVDELLRLLRSMRSLEPRLRWHVVAFFVDAEHVGRWEVRPRRKRRRASPLVYRRSVRRDARADRALALEGVEWIARRWNLRDLRGELVEPWLLAPGVDRGVFERLRSAHSGLVRSETG